MTQFPFTVISRLVLKKVRRSPQSFLAIQGVECEYMVSIMSTLYMLPTLFILSLLWLHAAYCVYTVHFVYVHLVIVLCCQPCL